MELIGFSYDSQIAIELCSVFRPALSANGIFNR